MDIASSVLLKLEPDQAVALWLEGADQWLAFHPRLDEVETVHHTVHADGMVEIERRWQGSIASAPAVLKPFVSPQTCQWTETITWRPDQKVGEWMRQARHAPWWAAQGQTRLTTGGSGLHKKTRWLIEGTLTVDPQAFDRVPLFLRARLTDAFALFAKALGAPEAALEAAAFTEAMEQWAGADEDTAIRDEPDEGDARPEIDHDSDDG